MAPYCLAENNGLTAREALTQSKLLMQGKKGNLFYLDLTFIGWSLVASLTFGIGYLWVGPYMSATMAAFYEDAKFG